MHKLLYCTTQSGYSAQIGDGVISQELDGGAPRFKRALKGTYHSASVRWVVKDAGYQYLMAFYRVWARNPNQRFLAKLCMMVQRLRIINASSLEAQTLKAKKDQSTRSLLSFE